ncbi:MAG TPA: metal ABC transporter ATP-binding protein [Candidatus Limnocylindria bacterium]|nr:metal ABC transporter ATP-binding protein [Candidatus Limnocylindria bacterium]
MPTPRLQLRDVWAGYDQRWALEAATLDVPAGSLVGVIGPNGSGKSTLLRAILGLVPHRRGTVLLDGQPISRQRHRLAYVPQRELVDWSFPISAEQVVMMGRYPSIGLVAGPRRHDHALVERALERVGMAGLARRQIGALSGGQQQRVFIARALVQGADVLLLDEPMTGVDLGTEETIGRLMRELRDAGTTVVYATHDLETAAEVSDLLCFVNGRVVAHGPPDETFVPEVLHATFGGELVIVDAGDHAHVHGGGHHAGHIDVPKP